jgi:predicted nucleotidyltransferase
MQAVSGLAGIIYSNGMASIHPRVDVTHEQIAAFCRKWKIERLELFGSVLRDDFDRESDIDILVTFAPDANWRFRDDLDMEEELTGLLGRHVDLVERRLVETNPNWVRRRNILSTAQLLYEAA